MLVRTGEECRQPGCPGHIVDGYCDVCGSPANATEGLARVGAEAPTPASRNLPSTPLGSVLITTPGPIRRPSTGTRRRSSRIGAGLTQVPPAPDADAALPVMNDPVVPEHRRFCANCGQPVGRSAGDQPGSVQGTCPACGTAFDFRPGIKAGDLIAGQYEVVGTIAYGGMGWIYLAKDRNVSDRWVVLKGLLNAADEEASTAVQAEKRHLAHVEHPLIVEIFNFVVHEGAEYIVMEFVPGRSLTGLLKERRADNGGQVDPLPVDWGLAYLIEIMPAISYLHEQGLLYCDLKPDNLMQVADSLKLIDLGGVRRIDDDSSPIYGTVGFQAPEVASLGPSIASDVYTIGRTLLVLVADLPGYQNEFAHTLPTPAQLPLLAAEDSLYRLLLRCCAPERADRFQSVEETRQQFVGVLREITARRTPGAAYSSAPSTYFEPPTATDDQVDWRQLPVLRTDPTDPMAAFLASLSAGSPETRFAQLNRAPQRSPAVVLEKMRTAITAGRRELADDIGQDMLRSNPWEWRVAWLMGVAALTAQDWAGAAAHFNAVYGQLPGELAPKFALAVACERIGERALAEQLYAVCASTDANYVTACAFGLARVREQRDDPQGVLAALRLVPGTSSGYSAAQRALTDRLLTGPDDPAMLSAALESLQAAQLETSLAAGYEVQIYSRAWRLLRERPELADQPLADLSFSESQLRARLEEAYRRQAVYQRDADEHNRLIERANLTRKWSLI